MSLVAGPHLSRTVSMPAAAAAASPRKRRNVADLLKAGSGGVTKSSPRSMMRAASALVPPTLLTLKVVGLLLLSAFRSRDGHPLLPLFEVPLTVWCASLLQDIPCPELMAQPFVRTVL